MIELNEFVSRDVLIRRRTERFMPAFEAAFAVFGYPTFALQRLMYRAVLSALLDPTIGKHLNKWEAITAAWHVANEMREPLN